MAADIWTDLTALNTYRVRARARRVAFPHDLDALREVLADPMPPQRWVVLGCGSNVILSHDEYEEDVGFLVLRDNFAGFIFDGARLHARAGCTVIDLSRAAAARGLAGLEVFCDIPGSLGGAVWMNAGAYGEELFDVLATVTSFDFGEGRVCERTREEVPHGYRHSAFQEWPEVVLTATLDLRPGADSQAQHARMAAIVARRDQRQPKDRPNAGSVFRRPEPTAYVGQMIEQLGLKGYRIGGAMVAHEHAGFIVNTGDATGTDILALIDHIKERVRTAFGYDLCLEQVVV